MYPKARIDAPTDGLFAVAMTLRVLDLRLPEGAHTDPAGFAQALEDLWSKFFPYALSFFILGPVWLANVRMAPCASSSAAATSPGGWSSCWWRPVCPSARPW